MVFESGASQFSWFLASVVGWMIYDLGQSSAHGLASRIEELGQAQDPFLMSFYELVRQMRKLRILKLKRILKIEVL